MDFDKKTDRRGSYCTQWDYVQDRFGKEGLLPFTISDMDFESAPEIIDALQKRIDHKIFGYSRWNQSDFKGAIKNWYEKRFQFSISEDWIVYSPSVMYSISKLIEMKSKEDDGILILGPSYDGFLKVIEANSRKILKSSLVFKKGRFEIDFEDFEKKCSLARIFLLCNPHNPTGNVWTEAELLKMIEICKKYKVFIISDEIHMDIVYAKKHSPILSIASSYHENIVLCTSASKTFNIPGLTGSYLLCPSWKEREQFSRILKERDGLSSASVLAIVATIAAYQEAEHWLEELKEYLYQNLLFAHEYMKQKLPKLKSYIPEGLYFLWIDFSELDISSEDFQQYLIEVGGLAIMPGLTYGKEGEYFLRFNLACPRSKVEEGLIRLAKTIEYIQENR